MRYVQGDTLGMLWDTVYTPAILHRQVTARGIPHTIPYSHTLLRREGGGCGEGVRRGAAGRGSGGRGWGASRLSSAVVDNFNYPSQHFDRFCFWSDTLVIGFESLVVGFGKKWKSPWLLVLSTMKIHGRYTDDTYCCEDVLCSSNECSASSMTIEQFYGH